ncbi:hypothetical protein BLNAU_9601 [Blattamonas nauphoetae]|uniref:Protein kinase domain-containing protein n=1 Tax=Blattamonas nauphoetae TaxID=2049346 RepID=A0ABQ9XV70_9EUKA|nr:hypothetical protein BLNAU_9601 [Blattamonas nauphoetae]
MIPLPLFLCFLQPILTITSQTTTPSNLTSLLGTISNIADHQSNQIQATSIPGGTYIGDNIEIKDRCLELSGERWNKRSSPETHIVPQSGSVRRAYEEEFPMPTGENCIFSLTNSTMLLKSLHFSLVANSEERRQQINKAHPTRLAIVSSSSLTVSESRIGLSSGTSAILISPSIFEESSVPSSVVMKKCSISSENGQLRGLVETPAFPDFGASRSISIIGCSFNSQGILGTDGIGLSLAQTARKSAEDMGMISSSLIDCLFVNMSSIGSSRQPQLSHLSQKMLGCVVSLTSSHLSGSTIRDVNNGGSVLCSNSSFSSLLSSPNTDTDTNAKSYITFPNGTSTQFDDDGTAYNITSSYGNENTFATFSHCRFTGDKYPTHARPLTFFRYDGTIVLLSCSFTNTVCSDYYAGAVYILFNVALVNNLVGVTSCNFTGCAAASQAGGMYLITGTAIVTVSGCRCVGCSLTDEMGTECGGMYCHLTQTPGSSFSNLCFEQCTTNMAAGGLQLINIRSYHLVTSLSFKECSAIAEDNPAQGGGFVLICASSETGLLSLSHLHFEDCSTVERGGGLSITSYVNSVSLTDCDFIRCKLSPSEFFAGSGGGLDVTVLQSPLILTACQFIDCASTAQGGALDGNMCGFEMTDCVVKNCSSNTLGAVCFTLSADSPIALSNVLFIGNTVSDTPNFNGHWTNDTVQFTDFVIEDWYKKDATNVTISDCWSTSPISAGMYSYRKNDETGVSSYVRVDKDAFKQMGPFMTQKVETSLDVDEWRIDLIVKGKIPLKSQIYEVTVKAEGDPELTGRLQIVNGVGSLVPSFNMNLKFSTTYTITSIVGIVPSASSSTMTNDISLSAEAWAFNLAATPSLLAFTTPAQPPTLLASSAHLTNASQPFAFLILLFDREVSGSYEIVVEERGKDERITVTMNGSSFEGESKTIRVVGDDRVLTHDTTYTIKSLSPTVGSETATTVWMNKMVSFHIPQSSYSAGNKALSPKTKALLSWLIPVVVSVCVALLVTIVVIVLLRRRYQKSQVPAKEMEEPDQVQVEDKMDNVESGCTNQLVHSDGMSHSAFGSSSNYLPTVGHLQDGMKSQTEAEWAEVMTCGGGFEISAAPITNTLYSVLHKERREIEKRGVGVQIVNGLKQVVARRGRSDVLTHLSSHWILLDSAGNVQLKLQMNASEAEQEAARAQRQDANVAGNENEPNQNGLPRLIRNEAKDKSGMESLRWSAPEVSALKGGQVDGHKASVFSLGLVLWEIETGQVPFGELDAVNAQRQSGTGIGPKMDTLKNEQFVSLIRRCVAVDPEQRPTLTEIGEFLSSHPDETVGESRNEMKE